MKIGFIGCGNMGGALAQAIAKKEYVELYFANRSPKKAIDLAESLHGTACDNNEVAAKCKYIFLAVKPYYMEDMLAKIQDILKNRSDEFVLVSIAAGHNCAAIQRMAGGNYPVIKLSPNTPVAVGKGMSEYCSVNTTDAQIAEFLDFMSESGRLDALDESLNAIAGTVSGAAPAWTYMFIEALADGGVACGLPRDKAMEYAAQMVVGAGEMVLQSGKHPGKLKDEVCSPNGSTIQGVRKLEERGFRGAVMDAVIASFERVKEMGK